MNDVDKRREMIDISEEILRELELEANSLVQILPKCKRLARLRNDFEALNWFSLELNGYEKGSLPPAVKVGDLPAYAKMSGRDMVNIITEEPLYYTWSVAEFDALIKTSEESLSKLTLPQQFEPTITHNKSSTRGMFAGMENEFVHETYRDVLAAITAQRQTISNHIRQNKMLLIRIRNRIHDYILRINYELRFETITENVFQKTRQTVEAALEKVCPDAIREFVSVFDRLNTENPIEWSQAMSSCRRIMKEFADRVFPPTEEPYLDSNGKQHSVKEGDVRNRLWAYIEKTCTSKSKTQILITKLDDLGKRVDALYDFSSKGMKANLSQIKKPDAEMCMVELFFLLGYLMQIRDAHQNRHE